MEVFQVEPLKYLAVLPDQRQILIFQSGPCGWRVMELKREQAKYPLDTLNDKPLVQPPNEFIAKRLSALAFNPMG